MKGGNPIYSVAFAGLFTCFLSRKQFLLTQFQFRVRKQNNKGVFIRNTVVVGDCLVKYSAFYKWEGRFSFTQVNIIGLQGEF